MTIWTLESLAETNASLDRLIRSLAADLPQQRPGESAQTTIRNLQTAARFGIQDVGVVVQDKEVVGVVSIRLDQDKHIGYVRLAYTVPGVEEPVAAMLVQYAFERVWSDPAIQYFDAMLFADQPNVREAFATEGVKPIARQEMRLTNWLPIATPPLPDGFQLSAWNTERQEAIAALILEAYRGTVDNDLYPDMTSADGMREFFHESLTNKHEPFDADASRLIETTDSAADGLAGQILCARGSDQLGWILEITVRPTYQRRGLGRTVLIHALNTFAAQGLTGAKLWVTLDNPARQLYESVGFQRYMSMWVYTTTRAQHAQHQEKHE
ncbi:MAG: GNAT family N-acetyltransferase [Aggregatilineales bacterium]